MQRTGWLWWWLMAALSGPVQAGSPGLVIEGAKGPGKGKHIVLVSGDEEYRSEEALPQLAKILARRHGFKCTVLFAINKKEGTIEPTTLDNIRDFETQRPNPNTVVPDRLKK
jgi:hypothetical protein